MVVGILVCLLAPLCSAKSAPPPPPVFPDVDFSVAHGTQVVKLGSVVDPSKATVVHLISDYCGITEENMKHLSTKADEFPNVNFIAILWFYTSDSKEYQCGSRTDCTSDGGSNLAEVTAYLPAGSKVKVVQDLVKERVSSGSSSSEDACKDKANNCASMMQSKEDCQKFSMIKDNCALSCETCTPAVTTTAAPTEAPPFTPGKCDYYCGAVWNWFGSDGDPALKWNMKENIVTFAPGGCLHGNVVCPESTGGNPGPKLWDGELKTKVDAAIAAVAGASQCENSVPAPAPSPAGPAPAPSPAGPAPEPAPEPEPAPAPAGTDSETGANTTEAPAPAPMGAVSGSIAVQIYSLATLATLLVAFLAF